MDGQKAARGSELWVDSLYIEGRSANCKTRGGVEIPVILLKGNWPKGREVLEGLEES